MSITHYTGMSAVRAHADPDLGRPVGAEFYQLSTPVMFGIGVVAIVLLINIGITEVSDDIG